MRKASLVIAAAIVVVANVFALLHVVRNRTGIPTAEITLTNRELRHILSADGDEDSAIELVLEWVDPNSLPWAAQVDPPPKWLDRAKLQTLGFDCSVDPLSSSAGAYYQHQLERKAFVALEYEGPAWQALRAWREAYERSSGLAGIAAQPRNYMEGQRLNSHLVAIDADLDRDRLRARYSDRKGVLILPAAIGITIAPSPNPTTQGAPQGLVQIVGHVQKLPYSISAPRPFSDGFRHSHTALRAEPGPDAVVYRVHLRYGSELEPWVTGVEFTTVN